MIEIITPIIPETLLTEHHSVLKTYSKDDIVFTEGEAASFYYQIQSGNIRMYNANQNGKEFSQGLFTNGQSFGEPPLFGDFKYPATAVCTQKTTIFKLNKDAFFNILKHNANLHLKLTQMLCKRMYYKATLIKEVSIYPPEHRILMLLKYLKNESKKEIFKVHLTRQEIANLTGLRVETVIRAIKKLEKSSTLSITNGKVFVNDIG